MALIEIMFKRSFFKAVIAGKRFLREIVTQFLQLEAFASARIC